MNWEAVLRKVEKCRVEVRSRNRVLVSWLKANQSEPPHMARLQRFADGKVIEMIWRYGSFRQSLRVTRFETIECIRYWFSGEEHVAMDAYMMDIAAFSKPLAAETVARFVVNPNALPESVYGPPRRIQPVYAD